MSPGRPSATIERMSETHLLVLPGGGYAAHSANEAEPVAAWIEGLGLDASVFRYPLHTRHPGPLEALRAEINRARAGGASRVGLVGFSAGGHLAGLAALTADSDPSELVDYFEHRFSAIGRQCAPRRLPKPF
jgi:acetyl esterase/lipase